MVELNKQILLNAGAHYGHLAKKWNPDFKRFLLQKKKFCTINLDKTIRQLVTAGEELKAFAAEGKYILFVGCKQQAKNILKATAQRLGQPYVTERWLGGTFTNFTTIKSLIKKLTDLEEKKKDVSYEKLTKKEKLIWNRKTEKLNILLSGLVGLNRLPAAVVIVDVKKEHIVVKEANAVKVHIVGLVDSDSSPNNIGCAIPCNDDKATAIKVVIDYLASQIEAGQKIWEETKNKKNHPQAQQVKTSLPPKKTPPSQLSTGQTKIKSKINPKETPPKNKTQSPPLKKTTTTPKSKEKKPKLKTKEETK